MSDIETTTPDDMQEGIAQDKAFFQQLRVTPGFAWMAPLVDMTLNAILKTSVLEPDERHGFTTLFHPQIHAEMKDTTILFANGRLVEGQDEEGIEIPFFSLRREPYHGKHTPIPVTHEGVWDPLVKSMNAWNDARGPYKHIQLLIPSFLVSVYTKSGMMDLLEMEIPKAITERAKHRFVFRDKVAREWLFTIEFVLDDLLEPPP